MNHYKFTIDNNKIVDWELASGNPDDDNFHYAVMGDGIPDGETIVADLDLNGMPHTIVVKHNSAIEAEDRVKRFLRR